MARHEITVGEFKRFVTATGYTLRATQRAHSIACTRRSAISCVVAVSIFGLAFDLRRQAGSGRNVIHVTARDAEACGGFQ
jgi:formylglycine-generating enzyme required for sulfatase activity